MKHLTASLALSAFIGIATSSLGCDVAANIGDPDIANAPLAMGEATPYEDSRPASVDFEAKLAEELGLKSGFDEASALAAEERGYRLLRCPEGVSLYPSINPDDPNIQDPNTTPPNAWGSPWAGWYEVESAVVTPTAPNYAQLDCFSDTGSKHGPWPDSGAPLAGAMFPHAVRSLYVAQDASLCFAVNDAGAGFFGFICPN